MITQPLQDLHPRLQGDFAAVASAAVLAGWRTVVGATPAVDFDTGVVEQLLVLNGFGPHGRLVRIEFRAIGSPVGEDRALFDATFVCWGNAALLHRGDLADAARYITEHPGTPVPDGPL